VVVNYLRNRLGQQGGAYFPLAAYDEKADPVIDIGCRAVYKYPQLGGLRHAVLAMREQTDASNDNKTVARVSMSYGKAGVTPLQGHDKLRRRLFDSWSVF